MMTLYRAGLSRLIKIIEFEFYLTKILFLKNLVVIKNCNNDTQNCGSAWIGLLWQNGSSDNSYSWSDGESVNYLNIDHSSKNFTTNIRIIFFMTSFTKSVGFVAKCKKSPPSDLAS